MLKFLFSYVGSSKSWCIMLIFFVSFQGIKINNLKNKNAELQYENEKYRALCLDYENKLKAQTALTEQAIKREQKAHKNESERKEIIKNIKPTKITVQNNKEIIDHETRKKVIARLNRSL